MGVRIVVQSRLSSTRMPAKALLMIGGRPLCVLAAQRAGNTGMSVVVATSDQPDDDAIEQACADFSVACFRGSLHDPLARFAGATADLADDDWVVRLTGDNFAPDGQFIESVIAAMRDAGQEYIRVAIDTIYGLGAEVFSARLLRRADQLANAEFDREHVTPWIRRHTADFAYEPPAPTAHPGRLRCTIDTLRDYRIAFEAMRAVADPIRAGWDEVLLAFQRAGGAVPAPLPGTRPNTIGQGPWLLGAVQIGVAYGAANTSGRPDLAEAAGMLDTAASLGVTHVDTARAYGDSEARIGQSLAHGLSEHLQVVTKVRPLDNVPVDADPQWAAEAVSASVAESLRQLRTNSVSALLLHRWADWDRGRGGVAQQLAELQASGTARVIGVSLSMPAELIAALADSRVAYVQLPFNALDRRWLSDEVQTALAARPEVIVTARSVFLQGLLVGGSGTRWPTNVGINGDSVGLAMSQLVRDLGRVSTVDLCTAYVRGQSFVTSVVLGAETAAQVREQADLFERAPLTADEIAHVHAVLPAGGDVLVDPSRWTMPV